MVNYTNEELLIEFIKWYWKEIQGKPYSTTAEEIIKYFIQDNQK